MLLLYNISRWGKGLQKCSLKSISTSTKQLKWPTVLRPDSVPKYEKPKPIKIWESMTIWDLAKGLKKDLEYTESVLKPLLENNYDTSNGKIKDLQVVKKFLNQEKITFQLIVPIHDPILPKEVKKKKIPLGFDKGIKGDEVKRPPVVTIMGHVDHGKTTLLDALRNSNVVDFEFGGITQHIGAFSVSLTPGNSVTFIDTPGHAAFSAMRNRGAEITDIVVLIVAADDGVMEQTIESIRMARNSGVKIIVAVNKIDKAPSDNLVKIKQELLEEGVQAEDLGGDVQVIPISALKRQNLDKLIEALLLEAEIMGLTGDPNGPLEGVIVESFIKKSGQPVAVKIYTGDPNSSQLAKHLESLRNPAVINLVDTIFDCKKFATLIVKRGTLRKRVLLLAGQAFARVRAMYNEDGDELSEVTLSQPALVSGWRDLPAAGDKVIEIKKERDAREAIKQEKKEELRNKLVKDYQVIQEKAVQAASDYAQRKNYISELRKTQNIEQLKQVFMKQAEYIPKNHCKLDIVIKGDVHGSVEAILNAVNTYNCNEQCDLKVAHFGVGNVTESDIELAEVFDATIYCFNLPFPADLKSLIVEKGIRIKFHNVIYKFIDDLKEEISSLLPAKEEEVVVGTGEVLQNFTITENKKKVPTAGCICVTGELRRDLSYKVLRNDQVIHDGKLKSMKHYKNEVKTIKKDTQCGIMFQDFTEEFKPGDKIICYDTEVKKFELNWNPGF